ncbi:serine threonine protein kinase [Diplodia corticola]|uniref:Serine threonine protein kinase n=1 Tax=Diplodia corticola TaxID=236234 RepID=A0A1J9RWH2_9PEZI|nr:serine threonine protein kinase [Diplodia corticola]OJD31829.1 serine threonine protein kinase [Diplodia corticola]
MECMRSQFKDGALLDGRFETLSALNHGSFGMVFMAKDLLTGESVAVKCLTKTSDANGCPVAFAVDDRSEELTIHSNLSSHPNIVNLIHTFETEHHVYLVLELCPNGDLYEAIRLGRGPLETEHVRDFMLQLISAVEFMHSKGIYHRDVKPENIFLTQDGNMKLGDFGLATTDEWSYESAVGSDRYMAPEQYDCGTNGYSPAKADIWAVGICLLNVLFSRNPFATPTPSDPLFRDFASDRESLFDVFPNMSQDTFEILIHCLAIDPENRSLSAVREALDRVISFTTDDESLDEFCNEDCDVIGATANREPLRTPSVSTANLNQEGAFPWARALAMTPPQPVRQLSTIHDVDRYSEDLFTDSERTDGDWCSFKPERSSVVSFVDSGLGISLQSNEGTKPRPIQNNSSRPLAIPGSMPMRPMPSLASAFGAKADMVSKSWSDLWDEEEEENLGGFEFDFQDKLGFKERVWSNEPGSGRTTPRAGLTEMKDPASVHNSRNRSPPSAPRSVISEQTGFIFEDQQHPPTEHKEQRKPIVVQVQHRPAAAHETAGPRYSPPPKKRSGFDMTEKWAALGNRRRAQPPSPEKAKESPMVYSLGSKQQKSDKTLNWKRGMGFGHHNIHGFDFGVGKGHHQGHQEWSLSKDWRHHATTGDDIGDLEWVGGWNDLHL